MKFRYAFLSNTWGVLCQQIFFLHLPKWLVFLLCAVIHVVILIFLFVWIRFYKAKMFFPHGCQFLELRDGMCFLYFPPQLAECLTRNCCWVKFGGGCEGTISSSWKLKLSALQFFICNMQPSILGSPVSCLFWCSNQFARKTDDIHAKDKSGCEMLFMQS